MSGKASKRKKLDQVLKGEADGVEKDFWDEGQMPDQRARCAEAALRLKSECSTLEITFFFWKIY